MIDQIYDNPCSFYCSNDSTVLNKSVSRAKNVGDGSTLTLYNLILRSSTHMSCSGDPLVLWFIGASAQVVDCLSKGFVLKLTIFRHQKSVQYSQA